MKKTVKTLLLLGSGLALLSFGVVVINQTAQVVELAKQAHPVLGTVTLWGLVVTYTGPQPGWKVRRSPAGKPPWWRPARKPSQI